MVCVVGHPSALLRDCIQRVFADANLSRKFFVGAVQPTFAGINEVLWDTTARHFFIGQNLRRTLSYRMLGNSGRTFGRHRRRKKPQVVAYLLEGLSRIYTLFPLPCVRQTEQLMLSRPNVLTLSMRSADSSWNARLAASWWSPRSRI